MKEFVAIVFDLKKENYVAFINKDSYVYLFCNSQIVFLKVDEIFTSVLSKYAHFADVFSKDLAAKLFKYTKNNNYTINLIKKY